jgi:hypothetical protein
MQEVFQVTERSDYRKLVKAATRAGAAYTTGRGHAKLIWPDGTHVTVPSTPGSGKAWISFRQRLRAKGVPV